MNGFCCFCGYPLKHLFWGMTFLFALLFGSQQMCVCVCVCVCVCACVRVCAQGAVTKGNGRVALPMGTDRRVGPDPES